jgi:hypothetical protein
MTRLPLALALLFAAASAVFHRLEYARLIDKHAWTAASITVSLALVFTAAAAAAGWYLGRSLRTLLRPGGDKRKAARVAIVLVLITGYVAYALVSGRSLSLHLERVRTETLTVERARFYVASGTQDEIRSVAYNRTCPPEILRGLASSPDEIVRAHAAGNPATPPEAVAALAKDPSETVRYYAESNPARKR